ncbi:hypothetical protein Ndes2526B_g03316 [Nannochloris sp. 'desiccata']|nr:hypothetical protein KSW81_006469 [Chlorella desiccata (nom. nud.)]
MSASISVTVNGRPKEIPIEINLSQNTSDLSQNPTGVLLTHGAGGDLSSGNLPNYARSFAEAGFPCLRFTCRGPLAHRVAVAKELLLSQQPLPSFPRVTQWIISGHSMGSRVAAQLASDLPNIVVASIFFFYPLHPPGAPEKLRDDPLASLTLPLLFIRGMKDPFCTEKPWKQVLKRLKGGVVEVHSVQGGGHGLAVSTGRGGKDHAKEEVLSKVLDAVKEFCERVMSFSRGKQRKKTVTTTQEKRKRHLPTPAVPKTSPKKKPKRK